MADKKKCLVVVDYQCDFVSGTLGFPGADLLAPRIAEKIKMYRAEDGEVIFTFDTHGEDYADSQEGKNLPITHCISGTPGHSLFGDIADLISDSDPRFYKGTFGSDGLYMYLKEHPFSQIELVGLVSNICVLANAVLAKTAQPETPVIVDAACTASHDAHLHAAALDVMEGLQVNVINR
jgi:nicotinamidase/pyrazinamidase